MTEHAWLSSPEDKLRSLLSDEAKQLNMLSSISDTVRQMQAKTKFRIALLNQLVDGLDKRLDALEPLTRI